MIHIISTAAAMILACPTATLKEIYGEGYREYGKIDLSIKTQMYPVGSKELCAYTLGHVAAEQDAANK